MKKNIMLIISQLKNGGAERSITNLANELKKYHNVILVINKKSNEDYPCNVKIVEIPELNKPNNLFMKLKGIYKLKKLKQKEKIDVSISYTTISNFYNLLSKRKEKIIISVRNHLSTKKEPEIAEICHKITIRLCDKIVCCSKSVEQDQITNFKANPKKLVVINNFLDVSGIDKSMNEDLIKKETQLVNDKLIVTMARLTIHKGHIHIIKAMSLVVKEEPDARLLIFSRGPMKEKLKELIKIYHLEQNIFFMDFHPNPYKFLKQAKAFILASDYEGFPNVIIEAMHCGVPVIATDAPGGSKEILSNRKKLASSIENSNLFTVSQSFKKESL